MKKHLIKTIAALTLFGAVSFSAAGGDAAVFQDIGFSEDGNIYIFGQYGKTDKNFEAWSEIFTVDVARNDFIKDEVFRTQPSKDTQDISGKEAFESLLKKAEWKLGKYNCKKSTAETLLYLRENENKKPTDKITFKNFEESTEEQSVYYNILLKPTYEGSGKNVKSSFYIDLTKSDQNGNTIKYYKVGTPSVKRQGITSYQIDRIFTDKSGKGLVFIIQKTLEDDTGTSIRYMVETVKF